MGQVLVSHAAINAEEGVQFAFIECVMVCFFQSRKHLNFKLNSSHQGHKEKRVPQKLEIVK